MSTLVPFAMFVIGFIVFVLYICGLVAMIIYSHKRQRDTMMEDPELQRYFADIEGEKEQWSINPHSEEYKWYKKNKPSKEKKNIGKRMFWD